MAPSLITKQELIQVQSPNWSITQIYSNKSNTKPLKGKDTIKLSKPGN